MLYHVRLQSPLNSYGMCVVQDEVVEGSVYVNDHSQQRQKKNAVSFKLPYAHCNRCKPNTYWHSAKAALNLTIIQDVDSKNIDWYNYK